MPATIASKPLPTDALLPPLSTNQRKALRASISALGIHTPIVQDQHGKLIDGLERLVIAEELGLRTYPVRTVHCPDERTRRHLRLQLNCDRRQLTRKQKRAIIAQELTHSPELSDRYVAMLIGVSHRTVADERKELERIGQIIQLAVKVGLDGKRRRLPVIPTETKTEADRAEKVLRSLADPPARPMRLQVAERLLKKQERRAFATGKDGSLPPDVKVFACDFRHLDLARNSVDLIFTDPVWSADSVALYADLAEFAARALKPGRLCCVYAAAAALPRVMAAMTQHLEWLWCLAVGYQGGRCHRNHGINLLGRWTPVLVFSKGKYRKRTPDATFDFLTVNCARNDLRRHHDFQQEGEPARYWIEKLSLSGDTILDPLCGSGQFALEAVQIGGRKVIACDIDQDAVNTTRRRLADY